MLRVVRIAAKLAFNIDPKTATPIPRMAHLLQGVSHARLFDEAVKLFHAGAALPTFNLLHSFGLFRQLFPQTEKTFKHMPETIVFIQRACANTDNRVQEGKTVTPAFLFAVMLWQPYCDEITRLSSEDDSLPQAEIRALAASAVLERQNINTSIPKHFTTAIREIWQLQHRLMRRLDKRSLSILDHPRFRAAYDFLVIYAEIKTEYRPQANWWTNFQTADEITKSTMIRELSNQRNNS